MSREINKKPRKCFNCQEVFIPSSRHKSCPPCRHIHAKTPCLKCGELCGAKYKCCALCANLDAKGNPLKGKFSHSWKGGVNKTSTGYIQRYCPGHPRLRKNTYYVFDHILVMEKKIGRYLMQGENVHHINGVKDDNRPENLELWIRNQPTGQGARDLLAYAREIIVKYESIEDRL